LRYLRLLCNAFSIVNRTWSEFHDSGWPSAWTVRASAGLDAVHGGVGGLLEDPEFLSLAALQIVARCAAGERQHGETGRELKRRQP
jgi:hypothetical protein